MHFRAHERVESAPDGCLDELTPVIFVAADGRGPERPGGRLTMPRSRGWRQTSRRSPVDPFNSYRAIPTWRSTSVGIPRDGRAAATHQEVQVRTLVGLLHVFD